MSPLNITVLKKVKKKPEKVKNNYYLEKHIFEKVGTCPLNIACMLIFHVQKGSKIFQNIV